MTDIEVISNAPETEPERQAYFIEACKAIIADKAKDKGRPLTCHISTFGCQMNAKDSEKLEGILGLCGYEVVDKEDADFVLFNTCTVRENANNKLYGHLGIIANYKKKNKDMIVGICGCMMQEPTAVEHLKKSYRYVNLIFGTHNVYKLAELLFTTLNTESGMIIDVWNEAKGIVEDLPSKRKYSFKSGVNIMYGCNNFCSYCIVPYVRGRERSREAKDIIMECERLAKEGVVEVMLLGQNVNSYGKGLENGITFAQLLEEVCKVDGIERVRFMTSHPKDLSDELIETMAKNPKICRHLHLPLQSGSDEILKKMNRHYDRAAYLKIIDKARAAMPDIAITTDIIVGFPGETEEDFLGTMDIVDTVGYDAAFTFIYSKRTGTPAAAMDNQVDDATVKDRFDRLLAKVNEKANERVGKYIGQTMEVLVEEVNESDAGMVTGKLSNNTTVHLKGDESLVGKLVRVKLLEAKGFYYMGEMV